MANRRSRLKRSPAPRARKRRGKGTVKVTESLNVEFDGLLARMQTPKARNAMKAAFGASSKQLGKAALAAKRTRRKPGRRVKLPIVRSKTPGTLKLDNAKIYEAISFP